MEAGVPVDSTLVFSATRLSPEKNVKLLPKIMEQLVQDNSIDYRLLIAGGGPEEVSLRSAARQFAEKMVFVGHLDKDSLADYYANTDVFIHPNPREPFGNVGLEAMASGAACVFPDTGGVLAYADSGNSWLVDADPFEMSVAVREAATNYTLRRSKIFNAVETARRNSEEAAVDRLLSTYDRMYGAFITRRADDAHAVETDVRGKPAHRRI
jgi:glycosyltransferase involved in cell wall biosynthesis